MLVFMLTNSACSFFEPPDIAGYVMKKEEEQILVVNPEPKDYSSTGGLKEGYDAIWVSKASEGVEVGQKVQVWFSGPIMESYPARGGAKKVSIIKSKQPKDADLSEAQVLRKVLLNEDIDQDEVMVVKDIKYDVKSDKWTINLKATIKTPEAPDEFEFKVEDK